MNIDGVELIDKKISNDKRGESWKIFESKDIKDFSNNEIFLSLSYKDVIRGMHFQPFPYGQKKIITVLEGCIEGVVLDLRNESDTYLKIEHIDFDADTPFSLLIPEYCAWGYQVMQKRIKLWFSTIFRVSITLIMIWGFDGTVLAMNGKLKLLFLVNVTVI